MLHCESCIQTSTIAVQSCTNGTVRLANGPLESAGIVEVCINGVWGTVCHGGWDNNAARVVCRQLGYNAGGELVRSLGEYVRSARSQMLSSCSTFIGMLTVLQ